MSGKKVAFGAKPLKTIPDADAWVDHRAIEEDTPPPEKMKRLVNSDNKCNAHGA